METEVAALANAVEVPAGLADKLMAIADAPSTETELQNLGDVASKPAANNNFFQYYAIAASLLLALGVTFSLTFDSGPSSAEMAVGDDVLRHLYMDGFEIDEVSNASNTTIFGLPAINAVTAESGTRLVSNDFLQNLPIRSARPCAVVPVSVEYSFHDDRFNGIVVPMGEGNMVLVGERNEDLEQYKTLFADNIDWVIYQAVFCVLVEGLSTSCQDIRRNR